MIQNGKKVSPMSNEGRNTYVVQSLTSTLLSLLSEKPMDAISISELIEKAGVGRASFYRNFESKEDIIVKYVDKVTQEFSEKQSFRYGARSFQEYTVMLFEHLERNKEICSLLLQNNLLYILEEIFDKYFLRGAEGQNAKYRQMFISGGFFNIFKFWLMDGCKETPQELSDMFFGFM